MLFLPQSNVALTKNQVLIQRKQEITINSWSLVISKIFYFKDNSTKLIAKK